MSCVGARCQSATLVAMAIADKPSSTEAVHRTLRYPCALGDGPISRFLRAPRRLGSGKEQAVGALNPVDALRFHTRVCREGWPGLDRLSDLIKDFFRPSPFH